MCADNDILPAVPVERGEGETSIYRRTARTAVETWDALVWPFASRKCACSFVLFIFRVVLSYKNYSLFFYVDRFVRVYDRNAYISATKFFVLCLRYVFTCRLCYSAAMLPYPRVGMNAYMLKISRLQQFSSFICFFFFFAYDAAAVLILPCRAYEAPLLAASRCISCVCWVSFFWCVLGRVLCARGSRPFSPRFFPPVHRLCLSCE